jgi:nucleoside-diphosphate-sugar epimerase
MTHVTATAALRLLVVGGNGFIGRHVVSHAAELGWDVTSLSLRPSVASRPGVRAVCADIADRGTLATALGDTSFDYVVNCGGYIDHRLFFAGGRTLIDAHFSGVQNLAEVVDRQRLRAFVNIGSSDEYGDAPAPQIETQREAPVSPYSLGKLAATHFLQMLHRTDAFPAVTLRLFLTYGPGQDDRRFLPQIIKGCLQDATFPTSEGEQLRDFCYIGDTVAAVFAALREPRALGEVFNVASGRPVTIRRMIETVRQLVGLGTPSFGAVRYRPGENMTLYANVDKAQALLGWKPLVSLDAGLAETIRSIAGAVA